MAEKGPPSNSQITKNRRDQLTGWSIVQFHHHCNGIIVTVLSFDNMENHHPKMFFEKVNNGIGKWKIEMVMLVMSVGNDPKSFSFSSQLEKWKLPSSGALRRASSSC